MSQSRPDGHIVVCSVGPALTSLLMELAAIDTERAFSYRQAIRMTDFAIVDLPTNGTPVMLRNSADNG